VLVDGVVALDALTLATRGDRVVFAGDVRPLLRVLLAGASPTTSPGSACVASGTLALAGRDVAQGAHRQAIGLALADAPQPDGFTVARALEWSARLAGLSAADARARAELSLGRVFATSLAARPARGLALVERRLVALAHAIVTEPAILVLEDPLEGLDAHGVERVREAIAASTEGRAAIVFLPRVMLAGPSAELVGSATYLVALHRGRVTFDGVPSALGQGARLFAVTACGDVEAFRAELERVGAEVHGGPHQISVSLPEGLGARDIVAAAARGHAGLLACAPVV